jgi:CRISPR/Cas system CMR-associated protein Cmr5 small subunit
MSIVLIGAFFLLNLTLAVINSKFTESQNKQIEKDRAEKREIAQIGGAGAGENENEKNGMKETMSIAQYINARIYAKKMIEFLRMRQEVKRIELERKQNAKI